MKNKQKLFLVNLLLLIISIIYIVIVKTVDVASIGPYNTKVGLSTINAIFQAIGYQPLFYNLTKILGIVPFIYVGYYGFIGLMQLIKTKSIKKIDRKILLLGVFYILLGLTYILFEKVVINYRPVALEGKLEASFPSSHTMLAVCICLSSLLISKDYIKTKYRKSVDLFTTVLMIVLVVGRLLSGVHWFSDILGGIIISTFLVSIYYTLINVFPNEKKS